MFQENASGSEVNDNFNMNPNSMTEKLNGLKKKLALLEKAIEESKRKTTENKEALTVALEEVGKKRISLQTAHKSMQQLSNLLNAFIIETEQTKESLKSIETLIEETLIKFEEETLKRAKQFASAPALYDYPFIRDSILELENTLNILKQNDDNVDEKIQEILTEFSKEAMVYLPGLGDGPEETSLASLHAMKDKLLDSLERISKAFSEELKVKEQLEIELQDFI